LGLDLSPVDFARLAFSIGIDKHSVAALAERFGQFGGELMASDDSSVVAGEFPRDQAAGVPAKSVVAAQRISVADDQHLAHTREAPALGAKRGYT